MNVVGKQTRLAAVAVFTLFVAAISLSGCGVADKPEIGLDPGAQESLGRVSGVTSAPPDGAPPKRETTDGTGSGADPDFDAPGGSQPAPGFGGSSGLTKPGRESRSGSVIIKYWNDTASNPPGRVEIVAQDASWKPKANAKSDRGALRPIPLGRDVRLVVYPDGRKGSRTSVTIKMSPEMDSRDVDAIHVELRDGQVRVMGNPVVGYEVIGSRG